MSFLTILRLSFPSLALALVAAGCGSTIVDPGSGGHGTTTGTTTTGTTTTGTTTTGTNGFDTCTGPGQCVLVQNGCCPTCGMETLAGLAAVNADQAAAYALSVCPEQPPCVACEGVPDPNLFAYCDNGTCRAADVRTHEVSACSTSADCTLRFGAECCQGCMGGAGELVAVSNSGLIMDLTCGPSTGCPKCLPQFPLDSGAICSAGHCAVVFAGGGGG